MAETLRGQLKRGLDNTVLYKGRQARSATFTITFTETTAATMSSEQLEYFQLFTKTFISNAVSESIYDIVVQNQEIDTGSLVVTGQVLGSDAGGDVASQSFAENVQTEILKKNTAYMEGLAYSAVSPTSSLDKIDASYFQDITAFQMEMEAIIQTLAPSPVPVVPGVTTPTSDSGNAINDLTSKASKADGSVMVIVAVIAVICVCIVILALYICCKCNRKDVLDPIKNKTATYPDIDDDDDDDNASLDKTDLSKHASSEKPPMTRSESSRRPSSSSSNGLQRGQSLSFIKQQADKPKLTRSKSGDGMPVPSRNADFKKSHSSDGLNSKSMRLTSLLEEQERPKRRPTTNPSSPIASVPLTRSKSQDGIERPPTPTGIVRRTQSGEGLSRPVQPVPPSPFRVPPKRENSIGGSRPPKPSSTEPGVARSKSGDTTELTPFSPKARVPPKKAQSMAVRSNQLACNETQPQRPPPPQRTTSMERSGNSNVGHPQRPVTSSQPQRPPPPQRTASTERSGIANGGPPQRSVTTSLQQGPPPPQRTPSLEQSGNSSGDNPQRPVAPPRLPSPRPASSMPVPSTPKRDAEKRTIPHTPASTPKCSPPQQHPTSRQSPQRTISLPVKNVQPNRPMVESPTKTKMDPGSNRNHSVALDHSVPLSPKRTKSMPVQHGSNGGSHANNSNSPTKLSPIT